jgi:glycosyltransferase involved in cell wall biosynthesis
LKIAIICSGLVHRGGIERVVLELVKFFKADIITGEYNSSDTFDEFFNFNLKVLYKGELPQRIKSIVIKNKFRSLNLDYDFYIFVGGGSCLGASRKNKPNLWWCCAPTIWLYSTSKQDLARLNPLKRALIKLLFPVLKKIDKKNVSNIDEIISISENVKQRVKEVYGRNSEIIFPFVDTDKFKFINYGDFYLSSARLTPDKRVDIIIKAFQKMPSKKLIVSGGGSELENIRKMAKGYDNIEVLGWISDERLAELYGKSIATIATSYYEDFGMIAVESMAAGKPVIASKDKGFAETIIDGKTGYLIEPSVPEVIKSVERLTKEKAKSMRDFCEKRAQEFSLKSFLEKFDKKVKERLNEHSRILER